MSDSINKQLTTIEEKLYQTKAKSGEDPLNYPIRLNDKLGGVFDAAASGNTAPSKQVKEVYADLQSQCDEQLSKLKKIIEDDVVKFNQLIREKSLPLIGLKKESKRTIIKLTIHGRYQMPVVCFYFLYTEFFCSFFH